LSILTYDKDVARRNMLDKQLLPFPTEFRFSFEANQESAVGESIDKLLSDLEVKWSWNTSANTGLCLVFKNVWSRSSRRKRKQLESEEVASVTFEEGEPKLGVTISVRNDTVEVRWLKGHDAVLYESFCGMIKRSVSTQTKPQAITGK